LVSVVFLAAAFSFHVSLRFSAVEENSLPVFGLFKGMRSARPEKKKIQIQI